MNKTILGKVAALAIVGLGTNQAVAALCDDTGNMPFPPGMQVLEELECSSGASGVVGAGTTGSIKSVAALLDSGRAIRAFGISSGGSVLCLARDATPGNSGVNDSGCAGSVQWRGQLFD